ncbi:kinesin-like protein KIF20A isoform X2 [Gadus macrocephalus]|uniref:kinesin-like protein KIF20A isoform X2 n=1 Tax=Gadus macrocephalus TaxID=80720 RepID=UPI0028CB4BDE|nr:kinesin-like protein KIF20A isoform X2 [Gadus macrocephalus]
MLESCLAGKPDREGPLRVDDIRKDLFQDYSSPTQHQSNIKQLKVNVQKENLQVYLRIRPVTSRESIQDVPKDCVTLEGVDTVVLKAPSYCQSSWHSDKNLPQTLQKFNFTKVLGPHSSQRQVFEGTVSPLVRGVLEGRDAVVFTYGVTNAGKTFTFLGPEHDAGILPRSLSVIFRSLEGRLSADCSLKPQRCKDVTKLTRLQQTNEATLKNQLLKLLKQSDSQKPNLSHSSTCSSEGDSMVSSASTSSDTIANSSANISANSSAAESDSFQLTADSTTEFSVWVSFCEIYRENIHDLLETQEPRTQKRNLLRLAQDVKGNSFIKDLRWVQVQSAEEAYRIMKIGKKNQSLFATKLNQLSSRSHSMFSIRILRLEKTGLMRVKSVSELCLCDLAGSERCTRTQSQGERLKEAGNINTSLLTLGKCLNAMRLNQHHRVPQHVPFRESKLTHFLQGFLCGRGAVCMIVNISQCPSAYDETLNVLKFSALAQKVVVLTSRPVLPPVAPKRTARELSMIINQAVCPSKRGRQSSMVAWETTLEDVVEEDDDEDDDTEEDEDEDEECMDEETVLEAGPEEGGWRAALELQIREEVSAEFMELFERMEKDYSERLVREREILEERAENRMEIMKTLVSKTSCLSATNEEEGREELEQVVTMITADLLKIKRDAEEAHTCLTDDTERETLRLDQQRSHDELETLRLEQQSSHDQLKATQERLSDLMEACQQKDDIIGKLQVSMETADTQLTRLQLLIREKTDAEASLSTLFEDAKSRLQILDLQLEEKSQRVDLLTQEADVLRQETARRREEKEEGASVFHAAVEEMRREGQDAVERSAQKRQHIAQLQEEMDQLRDSLTSSQKECVQLRDDLANQREESLDLRQTWQTDKRLLQQQAEGLAVQLKASEESCAKGTIAEERLAESESQCAALQQRLREKDLADEERKAQDEGEKEELRLALSPLQERLTKSPTETSSSETNTHTSEEEEEERGVEEVRGGVEEVVSREEEEEVVRREEEEEVGEGRGGEERKATVVEELKEELQRFHQRKEDDRRRAEFEAVKREMERLQRSEKEQKHPNTRTCRKRKSEAHPSTRNLRRRRVQEPQENDTKRKGVKASDGTLQRILNSPSILSSTAKSILNLVVNRSGEKEAVAVETRQKRGRKRLFKKDISSPLLTLTPQTTMEGSA